MAWEFWPTQLNRGRPPTLMKVFIDCHRGKYIHMQCIRTWKLPERVWLSIKPVEWSGAYDTVVALPYKTIETDYFCPKIIPGEPEIANDMRLGCVLDPWKALLLARNFAQAGKQSLLLAISMDAPEADKWSCFHRRWYKGYRRMTEEVSILFEFSPSFVHSFLGQVAFLPSINSLSTCFTLRDKLDIFQAIPA